MHDRPLHRPDWPRALIALLLVLGTLPLANPSAAQDRPVYRCPGNLYTDQLTAREAADRGCKTLEGAPVSVVQPVRRETTAGSPRETPRDAPRSGTPVAPRPPGETRIDPNEQRARDTDARRILETELRREEERLTQLTREAVPGGADKAAEHRAAIARKEADIAALRRELAKLGAP